MSRQAVEIQTSDGGARQVVADRVEAGLAVHLTHNGVGYTITHLDSGFAIWRLLPSPIVADQVMTRLLEVQDWTVDAAALKALAKELRPKMIRIAAELKIAPPARGKKK